MSAFLGWGEFLFLFWFVPYLAVSVVVGRFHYGRGVRKYPGLVREWEKNPSRGDYYWSYALQERVYRGRPKPSMPDPVVSFGVGLWWPGLAVYGVGLSVCKGVGLLITAGHKEPRMADHEWIEKAEKELLP